MIVGVPVIERSSHWDGLPARDAANNIGAEIFALATEIYPICRSITGNGVRETLACLGRHIPLQIREVPTGTRVFDWTIPREWNIRDAYIRNGNGERVVDFRKSNLHVMSYSVPVHARIPLSELRRHIFTLPDQPDRIPYRTSSYAERWGFCMSQDQLDQLPDGIYEVRIELIWRREPSLMENMSTRATRTRRFCYRRMSAIRRSPTTIAPDWLC